VIRFLAGAAVGSLATALAMRRRRRASLPAECTVGVSRGFTEIVRCAHGRTMPRMPDLARAMFELEFLLKVARAGLLGYHVTDADVETVGKLKAAAETGDEAQVRRLAKEFVAVFPRRP
jgi:hypothetical protein